MTSSRVLTDPAGAVGPDLDGWIAAGGGRALRRALDDPAAVLRDIELGDLRGMGGAGFPAHRKWRAVAETVGEQRWIIINGNEDEPGTFKDRWLLVHTPHQVLEGSLVAAAVSGASHVIAYVNPSHPGAVDAVDRAIAQWSGHPWLEELSERSPTGTFELGLRTSAGLYVGGEETAAIAAVEGRFPFPREKPPHPVHVGVSGHPTLVTNVETLAHAVHLVADGPDRFRSSGLGAATGTKLYSLSGDVLRPGLYELPAGTPLRTLIDHHGGGMLAGRGLKAVFTGGPSNTILTPDDLDVALDFDSLAARGLRLGTGAMIVVGEGTSVLRRVADFVDVFADGSCGQCPPCSLGTAQIARTIRRIDQGEGTAADLERLDDLSRVLVGSGRCGLVDGAATLLGSSLRAFRHEYEEHLAR